MLTGEIVDDEGDVTASTDGEITFEGMDQDNYNDDLEVRVQRWAAPWS